MQSGSFAHDMPRRYGYSLIGKRCYGMHNFVAKGRTNVIGALLERELLTVSLFKDNIDSHIFIKNKRYIDLSNCAGSQIIGHNNLITRKILKEISKKNISNFSSPNIYAVKFSKTLKKILPNFSKFIYCNSGSEAIMKGLRICRAVNSKEIIINTKWDLEASKLASFSTRIL